MALGQRLLADQALQDRALGHGALFLGVLRASGDRSRDALDRLDVIQRLQLAVVIRVRPLQQVVAMDASVIQSAPHEVDAAVRGTLVLHAEAVLLWVLPKLSEFFVLRLGDFQLSLIERVEISFLIVRVHLSRPRRCAML
ncbi:hypothetical protein [Stenotrophomonas oahuensis]|uniref:hypothetical protein n=1 Tax=Stenotrophomonas oahuensis TaxID=3003271 RepID=UPI003CCCFD6E